MPTLDVFVVECLVLFGKSLVKLEHRDEQVLRMQATALGNMKTIADFGRFCCTIRVPSQPATTPTASPWCLVGNRGMGYGDYYWGLYRLL